MKIKLRRFTIEEKKKKKNRENKINFV